MNDEGHDVSDASSTTPAPSTTPAAAPTPAPTPTPTTAAIPRSRDRIERVVDRIAGAISKGALSPSRIRGLRSTTREKYAENFDFAVVCEEYLVQDGLVRDDGRDVAALQAWAVVLASIAVVAKQHQPRYALGRTLRVLKYSEMQLTHLLRAQGDSALDMVPSLARRIAATGTYVDWADAAKLVLLDEDALARHRTMIARAYVR